MAERSCVCDSRYVGCDHPNPCGQPDSGTGHGPWCAECNPRRFAHIDKSLTETRGSLDRQVAAWRRAETHETPGTLNPGDGDVAPDPDANAARVTRRGPGDLARRP